MVSVIGKNSNLSIKGIRPARTLLPKYKSVLGDVSHLFDVKVIIMSCGELMVSGQELLVGGINND